MQNLHLSCVLVSTISNGLKQASTWASSPRSTIGCVQNKHPLEPHHVGVPSLCPKWFLSLWYVWRKPCTYLVSRLALCPNGPKRDILLEPGHLGVPTGASKMISEPMVRLAQTMHLSCLKISTISKWIETGFHLSIINQEYQRVRLKWFLSRWYIWPKPCTYLALTLTLSPNGLSFHLSLVT